MTKECAIYVMHHSLMNARRMAWTRGGGTWMRGLRHTLAFQQARTQTHTHTHTNTRTHTHTFETICVDLAPYVFSYFGNSNSKISVMKQALRLCRTGCGRRVSTARSFLCRICFRKQAVLSGSRSSGNKCPICPGNTGNSGNSSAKGALGNAGNRVRGKSKKIAGTAGAFKIAFNKESLERVFEGPTSRSTQSA